MAATTPLDPAQQADRTRWGFTDEEQAPRPHAFRDDLLAGQVCLVSGGGSGLGRAMAFLYARLGAEVMICGRREEKLQSTADGIRRLLGREIGCRAMTIRDPEQVEHPDGRDLRALRPPRPRRFLPAADFFGEILND